MKRNRWIVMIYVCLLLSAIPWYWSKDSTLVLLGMPAWVSIAIAVSFLVSVFTAFILIRYPWHSDKQSRDEDE